jgi:hypothetical protein
MSSFLQSLDLFGIQFKFKMNGDSISKSTLGGLLSIFFFVIITVFSSLNLMELISRAKPKIISYETSPKEKMFTPYNDSNLLIAFDMRNFYNTPIFNKEGGLSQYFTFTPYINYYENENNIQIIPLDWYPCNRTLNYWFMETNNVNTQNVICTNFNNNLVGGKYYGLSKKSYISYILYFNFRKFLNDTNNDFMALNSLFPLKLNVYFSIVGIDLLNFQNPLNSDLGYVYFYLNLNQTVYLFTQINKVKIYTDSNIMHSNYSTLHNVDSIKQDFLALLYSLPSEYYPILDLRSFMNPQLTLYYRSYTKLQDIINNISSVSSLLLFILNIIAGKANEYKLKFKFIQDNYLIREQNCSLMYSKIKNSVPNLIKSYKTPLKRSKDTNAKTSHDSISLDKDNSNTFNNFDVKLEYTKKTLNNELIKGVPNPVVKLNPTPNKRYSNFFRRISVFASTKVRSKLKRNLTISKSKETNIEENFSFYENKQHNKEIKFTGYFRMLISNYLCKRRMSQVDKEKFDLYEYVLAHFNKTTDISNIIKSLDHIEILKYFVLNPYQSNLLNNSKIILDLNYREFSDRFLQNKRELENYYLYNQDENMKFLNTINYFKDKIAKNRLNDIDIQVINKIKNMENN